MKYSQMYRKGFANDPISTLTSMLRHLSLFSEFEYRVTIRGNWIYTIERYHNNKLNDSVSFGEFCYLRENLLKQIDKLEAAKFRNSQN